MYGLLFCYSLIAFKFMYSSLLVHNMSQLEGNTGFEQW